MVVEHRINNYWGCEGPGKAMGRPEAGKPSRDVLAPGSSRVNPAADLRSSSCWEANMLNTCSSDVWLRAYSPMKSECRWLFGSYAPKDSHRAGENSTMTRLRRGVGRTLKIF